MTFQQLEAPCARKCGEKIICLFKDLLNLGSAQGVDADEVFVFPVGRFGPTGFPGWPRRQSEPCGAWKPPSLWQGENFYLTAQAGSEL
jgi:hypothetical protein